MIRYSGDYDPNRISVILGEVVLAINALLAGTTGAAGTGLAGPPGPRAATGTTGATGPAGGAPPMIWNSVDKGPNIVLADTDHTASIPTTNSTNYVASTPDVTLAGAGKRYAEFDISGANAVFAIGVVDQTYVVGGGGGIQVNQSFIVVNNGFVGCWGGSSGSFITFGPACALDICARLDMTPPRFYYRVDGGAWHNTGDPVAGTGGSDSGGTDMSAKVLRIALSLEKNSATVPQVTMNAGDSPFDRAPPAGFTAWAG